MYLCLSEILPVMIRYSYSKYQAVVSLSKYRAVLSISKYQAVVSISKYHSISISGSILSAISCSKRMRKVLGVSMFEKLKISGRIVIQCLHSAVKMLLLPSWDLHYTTHYTTQ